LILEQLQTIEEYVCKFKKNAIFWIYNTYF